MLSLPATIKAASVPTIVGRGNYEKREGRRCKGSEYERDGEAPEHGIRQHDGGPEDDRESRQDNGS